MNPWNDPNWKIIRLGEHRTFQDSVNHRIIESKETDILFAGSCDISGVRHDRYWHELYCEEKKLNHNDYVYIGDPVYAFPTVLRRIYAYLQSVKKAPLKLFLVVPASTQEHIINGTCYPINYRPTPMEFLYKTGLIPTADIEKIKVLQEAYLVNYSIEQLVYNFCRDFSFLEMICKAYNIDMHWTPNLTYNANLSFQHIDSIIGSHAFAKSTFLGYNPNFEIDKKYDAPSASSHLTLLKYFLDI